MQNFAAKRRAVSEEIQTDAKATFNYYIDKNNPDKTNNIMILITTNIS